MPVEEAARPRRLQQQPRSSSVLRRLKKRGVPQVLAEQVVDGLHLLGADEEDRPPGTSAGARQVLLRPLAHVHDTRLEGLLARGRRAERRRHQPHGEAFGGHDLALRRPGQPEPWHHEALHAHRGQSRRPELLRGPGHCPAAGRRAGRAAAHAVAQLTQIGHQRRRTQGASSEPAGGVGRWLGGRGKRGGEEQRGGGQAPHQRGTGHRPPPSGARSPGGRSYGAAGAGEPRSCPSRAKRNSNATVFSPPSGTMRSA